MTTVQYVDLKNGLLHLTDGEALPITNYFSSGDDACNEDDVDAVVAGPDSEGLWWAVAVVEEDTRIPFR